jgi:hypothetical protein
VFAQSLVRRFTSNAEPTSPPYSPEAAPHENGKPPNGKDELQLNGKSENGKTNENKENEAPNKENEARKENGVPHNEDEQPNKEGEEMPKKEPPVNGVHFRKAKMEATEVER